MTMEQRGKSLIFSIIMPCYNSSAYVQDAVDSLLAQSYSNWELIAVNDGSTDDTLDILQCYAKDDSRIKVYSKENGGYATAINYGMDRIAGDYFLMMGSDDRLASNLFAGIVSNITEELPDVIAFRAVKYEHGEKTCIDSVTNFNSCAKMFNVTVNTFEQNYPEHSNILFQRDTAKCFKRSLLGNLRYFGKYGYDADGVFSSLFMHGCKSFMCLPIDGYLWTIRDDSVSAKTNTRIDIDRLAVWSDYYRFILSAEKYFPAEREKNYFSKSYGIGIRLYLENKKIGTDIKRLIHSANILFKEINLKYKESNNHSFRHIFWVYFPNIYMKIQIVRNRIRAVIRRLVRP